MSQKRTRYAAVGTGGRVVMFTRPIVGTYQKDAELVGLCDPSEVRRTFHQKALSKEFGIPPVPTYADFDVMMKEQKPDVVIVCTPDCYHHEYIVRSLEAGADVVSEKPMTIDAEKCQAIFDAVKRTGHKVRTTFNVRWGAGPTKVRQLIEQGVIGRVMHVDFEYLLNTSHGADYFRRWHSHKEFSGGLLLHKSTHHFDLINWWINGIPETVFAMGDLVFYGKKNAVARGDETWTRYDRYTGVAEAKDDPFRLALDEDPTMREMYLNAEKETGYIRDQNVFREGVDIEDTMSVMVRYRQGAMLTYSLNTFCPREGFRASISGDRGRIEYSEEHASHIITGDAKTDGYTGPEIKLIVQKLFEGPQEISVEVLEGGHGGGDPLLQEQIFSHAATRDPYGRSAGHEQGAASLLIGAAANKSMATGLPVNINDLVTLNPSVKLLSDLI